MEKLYHDFCRLAYGKFEVGCDRFWGICHNRLQRPRKFVDVRDADVETQSFDILRHPRQRPMGSFAYLQSRRRKCQWPDCRPVMRKRSRLVDEPPESLDKTPGA